MRLGTINVDYERFSVDFTNESLLDVFYYLRLFANEIGVEMHIRAFLSYYIQQYASQIAIRFPTI